MQHNNAVTAWTPIYAKREKWRRGWNFPRVPARPPLPSLNRMKSKRPDLFHPKVNLCIRINSRFRPGADSRRQSPSRQLPVVWAKARARIVRISPIRQPAIQSCRCPAGRGAGPSLRRTRSRRSARCTKLRLGHRPELSLELSPGLNPGLNAGPRPSNRLCLRPCL